MGEKASVYRPFIFDFYLFKIGFLSGAALPFVMIHVPMWNAVASYGLSDIYREFVTFSVIQGNMIAGFVAMKYKFDLNFQLLFRP